MRSGVKILAFSCLFVAAMAAGDSGLENHGTPYSNTTFVKAITKDVYATPAVVFFGKFNGDLNIVRCLLEDPEKCEVFHQEVGSPIYSLHISGEYIYAGLFSGAILKCHLHTPHSCKTFFASSWAVWSLTSWRGLLLAGLDDISDGTIMACEKHRASCQPLHKVRSPVTSLSRVNNALYAGGDDQIMRCSLEETNNCTQIYTGLCSPLHTSVGNCKLEYVFTGIASMKNNLYLLDYKGLLRKCRRGLDIVNTNTIGPLISLNAGGSYRSYTWTMIAFNASLYVLDSEMGICKYEDNRDCLSYESVEPRYARSLAIAYRTHHMLSQFKKENTCERRVECQNVAYYNEHERAAFEVHVKNGRLYNSNDSLVDSSDADKGHAGPAAIFVMAPEGTIFLSNRRQGMHTSSLLAGNPVSGAGEMVVEKGVIKKILACSEHYKPDLELNNQVVQSLLTQGYMEPIVSEMCL